jgi:hypothetical protein
MDDIQILEDMRDEINGWLWDEDDYQMRAKAQQQFDALNWAIKELKNRDNYISKQVIRDKINEIEKSNLVVNCALRTCGKTATQYYQIGKLAVLKELLGEENA